MRKLPAFLAGVALAATACGTAHASSPGGDRPPSSAISQAGPTRATVAAWPARWCSVTPGTTIAKLVSVMGQPTDDSRNDPTNPQLGWSAYTFMFTAFIGLDGRVRQMDAQDTVQVSTLQPAWLPCPYTRTTGGI